MATEEKKLEAESIKHPPASSGSSSKVSPFCPGPSWSLSTSSGPQPTRPVSRVHIRTSGLIWSE